EENIIHTIGGQPALAAAQETIATLSGADRALLDNGLFVGVVRNEYQAEFARGDFLIRNVISADPQSGAIAIGDHVRAGQTVQFQVRDAGTADEDLHDLLRTVPPGDAQTAAVAGGLIFSCNGRGSRMFPLPGHDVQTVLAMLPGTPLAGFFAMGE